MTRKHYIKIADAIRDNVLNSDRVDKRVDLSGLIHSLSYVFVCDNNNFDKQRFINYINREEDK